MHYERNQKALDTIKDKHYIGILLLHFDREIKSIHFEVLIFEYLVHLVEYHAKSAPVRFFMYEEGDTS